MRVVPVNSSNLGNFGILRMASRARETSFTTIEMNQTVTSGTGLIHLYVHYLKVVGHQDAKMIYLGSRSILVNNMNMFTQRRKHCIHFLILHIFVKFLTFFFSAVIYFFMNRLMSCFFVRSI